MKVVQKECRSFIFALILFFFANLCFAQDSLGGFKPSLDLNCTIAPESLTMFEKGLYALYDPEFTSVAGRIFYNITQNHPEFCDAYYYTGKALDLQEKFNNAFYFYYMADSLSNGSDIKFQHALAQSAIRIHNVVFAREKYTEILRYHPTSSVGHFGFALTSSTLGDFEQGIEHLNKAISLYAVEQSHTFYGEQDLNFVKGVLLVNLADYENAWQALQLCNSAFSSIDVYQINTALCALELYEESANEKWRVLALQAFDFIKDKSILDKNFIIRFQNALESQ